MNRREIALKAFLKVQAGKTLPQALEPFNLPSQDEAWIVALLDGSFRHYFQIKTFLNVELFKKPLPPQGQDIESLCILALYELIFMRSATYAAVNEWVGIAALLKKKSYTPVINAICRRYEREKDLFDLNIYPNSPSWLSKKYRKHYPTQAAAILAAQDHKPPLFLRVNIRKISVAHLLQTLLEAGYTATLKPELDQCIMLPASSSVPQLPGYQEGWFYVQDYSAQFAAVLLDCKPEQTVLDMCAAPGGKTLHLLEREPSLKVTAVDTSAPRLQVLQENLSRCGGEVKILDQDMTSPNHGFSPQQFDRILLDAPCSGTGVIRRHPEIKMIRNSTEIQSLVQTQSSLLETAWPLLKVGGILLYATCSLLPEENEMQILNFLAAHQDAALSPFELPTGSGQQTGWQLFPQAEAGDGFYYAKLIKANVNRP